MDKEINEQKRYEAIILEEFLPMFVTMMKDKNGKLIPTIKVDDINYLNLKDKEKKFLIRFLEDVDVLIIDSEDVEEKLVNYDKYEDYRQDKNEKLPPLLTNKETNNKFKFYKKTKDPKIREELILGNMRLVTYFSWYYSKVFSVDISELEQYGYEGLVWAVDKFDIDKYKGFYAYAKLYIRRFINKGLRELLGFSFNINISSSFLYKKAKLEKLKGVSLEEDPSLIDEIVDEMVKDKTIGSISKEFVLQGIKLVYENDSIESLLEKGQDIYYEQPENKFTSENKKQLDSILSNLSLRDQLVLKLRYGLEDGRKHTLEEIGNILNVTKQSVARYLRIAIRNIKRSSILNELKYLYNDEVFIDEEPKTMMDEHHLKY